MYVHSAVAGAHIIHTQTYTHYIHILHVYYIYYTYYIYTYTRKLISAYMHAALSLVHT